MDNNKLAIAHKLREIRKSKNMTINELSKRTGLTASFISQLERGLTSASVATLQKIAVELEISLSVLFDSVTKENKITQISTTVTRKDSRKKLVYRRAVDYLLDSEHTNMEIVYSEIDVGGGIKVPYHHKNNYKNIFVIEGTMEITIEDETYILNDKDSISFSGEKIHKWANIGNKPLKLIWLIS